MTDGCFSVQTGLRNTPFSLCQVGAVFRNVSTKVDPRLYEPLSVGQRGVTRQLEGVALQQGDAEKKLIRPGQIAMNSRSDRRGASGLSEYEGVVSVVYTVLQPDLAHVYPRYAHYLFRSLDFQNEYYRWGTGIVDDLWSTKYERLAQIPVPCPTLATQRRIADYLDEEVREMDALIARLENMISLLGKRELASAKMHLQGLLANGFKETHLGLHATFIGGVGFSPSYQGMEGEQYPFYKVGSLSSAGADAIVRDRSNSVSREVAQNLGARIVPAGSILLAKVGEAMRLNRFGITGTDCCIDNNMLAIWPDRESVDVEFLRLALTCLQIVAAINPGPVPSLNMAEFRNYKFPLPPLEIQHDIAGVWLREMRRIHFLISEATELIENLKARKTALITEVVTGRKKV